jgi:hypothetical protein
MNKTAVGALAVAVVSSPLALVGLAGLVLGGYEAQAQSCGPVGAVDTGAVATAVEEALSGREDGAGLTAPGEQIPNAVTIQVTGVDMGVSARGQEIALATAAQESGLRNLDYGDRDSLGLFQQRPSQGWGSAQEILDPEYAATQFYQALLAVPGWQELPLTEAAQAVQRSAYPDAYARWEPLAEALQQAIAAELDGDGGRECERPLRQR